jgi:hypothetical protein
MVFYESELAEAMLNAIADGHSAADAKNDIKVFQEAVNLLPKYNTPELKSFLLKKLMPNSPSTEYELFESIAKLDEGWFIALQIPTFDSTYRIERCDEKKVFKSDNDAIRHVWEKAKQKSKVHLDTIVFMMQHGSAHEMDFIVNALNKTNKA